MESIVLKAENGKEYKLEFNRRAIVEMEKRGFDINKASAQPLSTITYLTRGAFIKNYPSMSEDEVDKIIEQIQNIDEFVQALIELYANSLQSFVGNKELGNATWGRA